MPDDELYYLKSIRRQLRELRDLVSGDKDASLGGLEALADNIDWLDCYIDDKTRERSS